MLNRDFERIEVIKDRAAGCTACVVVHSTRLGPAFGGIRRWPYRDVGQALADALDLAEAMTWKCAVAGVPGGGGKAVIVQHPDLDRAAAYRLVGRAVQDLAGRYFTGPDVGTEPGDLLEVAGQTRYVAHPGPQGPGELGGSTALGVVAGIEAVVRRLGFADLRGVRVAVQGLGDVGLRVARQLAQAGARLEVADLRREVAERVAAELGAALCAADAIVGAECDVLAPCALGGVIDDAALPRLRARAVAGSANNVLASPAHGAALFERGVLYAPDFVINAGGLLHGALFHLEGRVPPAERIRGIGATVGTLLDRARAEGVPPEVLAKRLAAQRVDGGRP